MFECGNNCKTDGILNVYGKREGDNVICIWDDHHRHFGLQTTTEPKWSLKPNGSWHASDRVFDTNHKPIPKKTGERERMIGCVCVCVGGPKIDSMRPRPRPYTETIRVHSCNWTLDGNLLQAAKWHIECHPNYTTGWYIHFHPLIHSGFWCWDIVITPELSNQTN